MSPIGRYIFLTIDGSCSLRKRSRSQHQGCIMQPYDRSGQHGRHLANPPRRPSGHRVSLSLTTCHLVSCNRATGVNTIRIYGGAHGGKLEKKPSMEATRIRPSGKKGLRKQTRNKRRSRQPWSDKEVKELRSLAKANTPTGVISLKTERPMHVGDGSCRPSRCRYRPRNRDRSLDEPNRA